VPSSLSLQRELQSERFYQRSAVYPGLGERWDRPATQGLGIRLPANSIRRLTEKIVRGVYFLEGQKFVEPSYVITLIVATDEQAAPIEEILAGIPR
jgi:hypothetical protein